MIAINQERFKLVLLRIIKIGILFILFLPLIMHSYFFFPFIVVKNILFRIAVEIIFVAYLILAYLDPAYRPKFNKLTVAVLIFFIIAVVASLAGIDFRYSLWGNYERMGGLFHLSHLVLYFFVLVNTFKTKRDWHSFFTFSIFVSLLMSFLALAQWLEAPFLLKSSGGKRLSGTVGNATFFAAYLLFHLFFLLYFLAKEKRFQLKLLAVSFLSFDIYLVVSAVFYKLFAAADWGFFNFFKSPFLSETIKYPKLFLPFLVFQLLILAVWFFRERKEVIRSFLIIIFLFEFFIFFNTQTRGALIGFVFSLILLAFISLFLKFDRKIKAVILVFLILGIISPFILVKNKNSDFIKRNDTLNRLARISLTDVTTESRLLTWQASFRGWREEPKTFLLGYGLENYYYVFNKYFPVKIYRDSGSQIWFDRAHNIIFDIGVTTGILGLLSYLSIFGFAFIVLFRNYQQNKVVSSSWLLMALLIAYFLQNFFVFDTLNTEIPFYLFLGFITFLHFKNKGDEENEPVLESPKEINYIYIVTLILILLFSIFAINVRTLKANNYLFSAVAPSKIGGNYYKDVFDYFVKAINQALPGKFEAREQLANYAIDIAKEKKIAFSELKKIIDYAEEQARKSIAEQPLNVRNYLVLSTFYNATVRTNMQNPQKVIDLIQEAMPLSPTRPQLYYEIAQAYAFTNNFEKVEEYFKKGLALAPRVIDDNWNLLAVYVVFGRYDAASAHLKYMQEQLKWQPTLADYLKLTDLYGRAKQYSQAIEFSKIIVELESSAKNYAQLAALYAKIGENDKAKEATEKAVELDPAFAAEAKVFLERLQKGELLEK